MSPLTESTKLVLKSYGTPTSIAGSAPSLDYRFALDRSEIDAVSLTDKLTFTRSSSTTFTNSTGSVELAGANIPRFNHNSSTRQSQGLLLETGRTNLLKNTSTLNAASWSYTGEVSYRPNSVHAPDGTLTGWQISGGGLYNGSVQNVSLSAGSTYAVSVWLLGVPGVNYSNMQIGANQSGNTLNVGGSISSSKWTRVSYTFTSSSSSNTEMFCPRGGVNYYIWGPQIEASSSAGSYIVSGSTTGSVNEAATVSLAGLPATRTLVEKPTGCASISGDTLTLNPGYTIERVMVFPVTLTSGQISAIRSVM